jgi:hypothetical protein
MEENNDTIVLKKKDVIRAILFTLPGIVVIILGLIEFQMIISWGSIHHIASQDTPILYAILYLMVILFASVTVFVGFVWFDLGQVKYKLAKLEETLIKEIREVRHLDENLP